jgi:hypothetical protein
MFNFQCLVGSTDFATPRSAKVGGQVNDVLTGTEETAELTVAVISRSPRYRFFLALKPPRVVSEV